MGFYSIYILQKQKTTGVCEYEGNREDLTLLVLNLIERSAWVEGGGGGGKGEGSGRLYLRCVF